MRGIPARLTRIAPELFRASPVRSLSLMTQQGQKNLICGRGFRVTGGGRLECGRGVRLGTRRVGFVDMRDGGLLRNRGTVRLGDHVSIGVGCRWDIGPDAVVEVGELSYFSPFTRLILSSGLSIGKGCAISWNVEFLDDDFHHLAASANPRPSTAPITIGDHVWIGAHAKVLKGVRIANGCVVAAGAVVTRSVDEENCLVVGNPAQVVKRDISWSM